MKTIIENFLATTGMTRAQLAKESGVSAATISRMLASERNYGSADSYIKIKNFIDNFFKSNIKVEKDKRKK